MAVHQRITRAMRRPENEGLTSVSLLLTSWPSPTLGPPGAPCGAAGTSDIVDAALVVGAIERDHTVVTSDPTDIALLADAAGAELVIHPV